MRARSKRAISLCACCALDSAARRRSTAALFVMRVRVAFLGLALCVMTSIAAAQATGGGVEPYKTADMYVDLRNRALGYEPANAPASSKVIAVLMETGYPEAIATLVAVSDGAVSLYFSNGGGIIGAGEHIAVREVASVLLSSADALLPHASKTEAFPLPLRGHVRFYLVTTSGVFTAEALEDDLGYQRHSLSPLFHQAHELIAAVREHAPQ